MVGNFFMSLGESIEQVHPKLSSFSFLDSVYALVCLYQNALHNSHAPTYVYTVFESGKDSLTAGPHGNRALLQKRPNNARQLKSGL